MAQGSIARELVEDGNAPQGGNAQVQRLAIGGVSAPSGPARDPDQDSLATAINQLGVVGDNMRAKQTNADFLEGQMAQMAGQTQDEVSATGNRTTMAGFVALDVANAVQNWEQEQMHLAATTHSTASPEAFQAMMSAGAADLIAQMGGDAFAQGALTDQLAPAMSRMAATQQSQHSTYLLNETVNSYENLLLTSSTAASQNYAGATTSPNAGPTGATTEHNDYRAIVAPMIDGFIQRESGNNPNAQNPDSSAGGLGQFIDSTWIETLTRYRPDLTTGASRAEILAMKTNGPLNREMTHAYGAQNASALARSGFPVNSTTVYLTHFAGLSGGRRVLRGDPSAPVSTTLTRDQIAANVSVTIRDGRLITNAELIDWAKDTGEALSGAPSDVRAIAMTNPGIPPAAHRAAVVSAVVSSLGQGDGSLYQGIGGLAGIEELNLSAAQQGQIFRANEAFTTGRENEYSMDYQRDMSNILTEAATGEFSEDDMFVKLEDLYSSYDRTDIEMRRVHTLMQATIDQEVAGVFNDPELLLDVVNTQADVRAGTMTVEDGIEHIMEVGELNGATTEETEAAVAEVIGAHAKLRAAETASMESARRAGLEAMATIAEANRLVVQNALGTGNTKEIEAGIELIQAEAVATVEAGNVPPSEQSGAAQALVAQTLVQQDVVDPEQVATMRAALANPIGADGEATDAAEAALAYYLDIKVGANAAPEYLARMFAGNETMQVLLASAESFLLGDLDVSQALTAAKLEQDNPVSVARVRETAAMLRDGTYATEVVSQMIDASGLANTQWNRFFQALDADFHNKALSEEGRTAILEDAGVLAAVDEVVMSVQRSHPNADTATIAQLTVGHMANRGTIMGSSFVMAPVGSDAGFLRKEMGLTSTEANVENTAVTAYVREHGEELFGPAIWADIGPSFGGNNPFVIGGAMETAGRFLTGQSVNEASRASGQMRPEFSVEYVGGNFIVRPFGKRYDFAAGVHGGNTSTPLSVLEILSPADIGDWYNAEQLKPSTAGAAVNAIRDWMSAPDLPSQETRTHLNRNERTPVTDPNYVRQNGSRGR
jgi:hypothetical protein